MAEMCFTDDGQLDILRSSSDAGYPEDKEEEDNEKKVQIEEEIDNDMEVNAFQKEEG
jgi:hypothetical protein